MLQASTLIKQEALRLGFSACGICKADFAGLHASYFNQWLENGSQGEMSYMQRHVEKRTDPRLLVENAKSVIVTALNYYPEEKQRKDSLQISYYACGKDYHIVVKEKLQALYQYINQEIAPVKGRIFCDTAPLLEKYYAMKAGIGWIGKHTQLIIPDKGSYFFLGEIVLDMELDTDAVKEDCCGTCTKCMDACPVQALTGPHQLDAVRCLSYLTIEHKGAFPVDFHLPCNQIYGCDICNKVCPWNKDAQPTTITDFYPSEEIRNLTYNMVDQMDENTFNIIFDQSPVRRIGLPQLRRNLSAIKGTIQFKTKY